MKIIAVEEHILTPSYIEYLFQRKEYPRREYIEIDGKKMVREWWSPTNFRLMDPAKPHKITFSGRERIKDMDKSGIDFQIISLSFPSVERFEPEDGTRVASLVNDDLAKMVKEFPDRFAAYAVVAPQKPETAAAELERAVTTLGFKGLMVNGHIRGEYLDEKKYWCIFEVAEKLDVPVYLHPGMPSPDMLKPYLTYPGLSSAMLGFAADTSLHAMRLILSGVFDRFPKLKIILGHLGEALPFWLWRMDSRFREEVGADPNSAEFYKNLKKTPSQYFKDNFYVSISGMYWSPVLDFVLKVLGADKILFAADYPYEDTAGAVKFINDLSIKKEYKEKICYKNAERIFKL